LGKFHAYFNRYLGSEIHTTAPDAIISTNLAFADIIYSAFGPPDNLSAGAEYQGIQQLIEFPRYGNREFDYTSQLDTVDAQFGGLGPAIPGFPRGSLDAIPTGVRPRDAFAWQKSPRELTNGNPQGETFAGVDFELAYWMAVNL
jgi:hypothetical protein